jgi:Flp pilus assembly protein TadG
MLKNSFRGLGHRANVSVEFALISVFFLLPLFGGSVDMVEYISAKAQLNTALQALYYYALTSPSTATISADTSAVVALMSGSPRPITLVGSSVTYDCIANSATTVTYVATSPTNTNGGCTSSQTQRTRVTYSLSSSVFLTVPMPFVSSNPLTVTVSGTVQVQ